ncbi:HlyD family type I secretion periplasmic adaptor subunit [Peteryoungia ipomoeae]|uniref:Membrane fusion protein (MFP) family protein n=1 Tax=Peteryoungia ipomoeae TaxID=1210932 RepID=A0A4S8NZH7_9HYPH|nr:HlyD family type I secretion periplasmic adaptor subunit [Peteryoungia ipomoeae]THV20559.1 HlyD family type I secretion periplasmic adaptor subunit [Peteryoungia ipomoeae]
MTQRLDTADTNVSLAGKGLKGRMLAATALGLALTIGIGGWAAQAKLAGAVISQGELVVTGETKQVQHVDGGTIVAIPVKIGSSVKKGEVVLRLDDTQLRLELGIVQSQLAQLQAMRARLVAERDGADLLSFDGLTLASDITREERKLFDENREMRENQRQQIKMQIAQLHNQIDGLREQEKANLAENDLLAEDLAAQEGLVEKGLAKASELRGLRRQMVRIEGTIGDLVARVAEAQGQISELNVRLMSVDQTSKTELQKEIVAVESRLTELEQRALQLTDRLERTVVKAPESGTVYDLQAHTIGGVVAPGQVIMAIVPQDSELNVHVKVAPTEIDRIFVGQVARMRFTAFNRQTTPEIVGAVDVIPAATVVDKATNLPFYKTSVTFAPDALGELATKLTPGMPVEVYIETEERTVISFLAKPFTDQISRAFREE